MIATILVLSSSIGPGDTGAAEVYESATIAEAGEYFPRCNAEFSAVTARERGGRTLTAYSFAAASVEQLEAIHDRLICSGRWGEHACGEGWL